MSEDFVCYQNGEFKLMKSEVSEFYFAKTKTEKLFWTLKDLPAESSLPRDLEGLLPLSIMLDIINLAKESIQFRLPKGAWWMTELGFTFLWWEVEDADGYDTGETSSTLSFQRDYCVALTEEELAEREKMLATWIGTREAEFNLRQKVIQRIKDEDAKKAAKVEQEERALLANLIAKYGV